MEQREVILQSILERVSSHFKNLAGIDSALIEKAIQFGKEAHRYQLRKSGVYYFCHPLKVAYRVSQYLTDETAIIGALLHDVIEDTNFSYRHIQQKFGKEVADLVLALTKVSEDHKMTLKKIFQYARRDFRVILIKLLDRIDNLGDMEFLSRSKTRKICKETQNIYIDVAHGLGLLDLEEEMKNLIFLQLYPRSYQAISHQLHELYYEREVALNKIIKSLENKLPKNLNVSLKINLNSPQNYFYSRSAVDNVLDSINIITASTLECYEILGILHTNFRSIPLSIRDYISNPKANGWRGLETEIIILGERIKFFVVNRDFHEKNRNGLLALMKEGIYQDFEYQNFLSLYSEVMSENLRIEDIFRSRKDSNIQVLTPKGKVIELRYGATVLDFSFMVHSSIGFKCNGGIINGTRYPRNKILEDGMVIDILSDLKVKPEKEWLNFVVMPKARREILKYLTRSRS